MNLELCFFIGLFLVLFSPLIVVLVGLRKNRPGIPDTTRWRRTPGVVEESAVQVQHRGPENSPYKYLARVRYAYQVENATLRNDEIWLNSQDEAKTYDQADLIAERYFTGRKVMVFFDPHTPRRAVLEPGFHAGSYLDAFRSVWMFLVLPSLVIVLLLFGWLSQLMK